MGGPAPRARAAAPPHRHHQSTEMECTPALPTSRSSSVTGALASSGPNNAARKASRPHAATPRHSRRTHAANDSSRAASPPVTPTTAPSADGAGRAGLAVATDARSTAPQQPATATACNRSGGWPVPAGGASVGGAWTHRGRVPQAAPSGWAQARPAERGCRCEAQGAAAGSAAREDPPAQRALHQRHFREGDGLPQRESALTVRVRGLLQWQRLLKDPIISRREAVRSR